MRRSKWPLFRKAVQGNVEAQKFYLTNRAREEWANRHAVEHSGGGGGPIAIAAAATIALQNVLTEPATRLAAIDYIDAELVPATPEPMQDNEPVPDDLAAHWRIAAPANVAVTASRGEWVPAPHLMYLSRNIVEMVTAPSRRSSTSKRRYVTGKRTDHRVDRGWALGLFPAPASSSCATGDLAERFSRRRDIFTEWGPTLSGKHVRQDVQFVDEWRCPTTGRSAPSASAA